jgi:hypothetical protein
MEEVKSKWGVPCPDGENCTHNRPDKCTGAWQRALAKEVAEKGKSQTLSGAFRFRQEAGGHHFDSKVETKIVVDASGAPTPTVPPKPKREPSAEVKALAEIVLEKGVEI